ncbi:DUF2236 domain-containing protein [Flavobacterium sp. xlx-214]|uniref:oxygenase MpaB family protein n=1 Tax=unclassified Flavobacterium TaxID=196869 RepID=UPI0013D86986|nr:MULTISPECIES: oxygenase MpaB family protein [unclassified Flavobacterium]MBA5793043.1 DUF2236 domain-containing protein [Flavobacterium sp. xlx-221]QMI84629.1 DUF2236 domain-containing protein [Flavobacterium sp. xlx-214]
MNIPARHIQNANNAFTSYWEKQPNNLLPHLLPTQPNIADSNQWIPYYFEVDTLGDAVATEYLLPNGLQKGIQLLMTHYHNYPQNANTLSKETITLFAMFTNVPNWVQFDVINAGAAYCNRCGTSALSVLRNYCLMGGYESSAINKPLIFTEALKKGAVKRLADTVDFWMYVTEIDGLKPTKNGLVSVLLTRIIHSFSRISIEKTTQWDENLWGKPINIWDMVATNLGFSIAFMDGLAKLQLAPTQEETKGTLHLWKYVGYLLGIPIELLPDTAEDAAYSLYLWSKTQKGIDDDSKALAYALYQEPLKVQFTKNTFMKWFVQKTNLGYNEVLLGTKSRAALGLPYSKAKYWIKLLNQLNKTLDKKAKRKANFYTKMVTKGRKEQVNVWHLYQSEKKKSS